jgi:hypothetical protein
MTYEQRITAARRAAMHFTSPQVAADCEVTFEELRGFISGWFVPSERQLMLIERRCGVRT